MIAETRAVGGSASSGRPHERVEEEFAERLTELVHRVGDLPGGSRIEIPAHPDRADFTRVLNEASTEAVTSMTRGPSLPGPERASRVSELLGDLRGLQVDAERTWAAERELGVARGIRNAVAEMRVAASFESLCEIASRVGHDCLGFDRTLISTVENGRWNMRAMHVPRAPSWAREMLAVGMENPHLLDETLIETDVVTSGRPAIVTEVPDNPRVFREFAEIGRSQSYGLAPVEVGGRVVGMVHADQYFQRRVVTSADRVLLEALAEGFAQSLAMVRVREGLAALQNDPFGPAAAVSPGLEASGARTSGVAAAADGRVRPAGAPLTPRETDVAELLAQGAANRQIARRLRLSEATVKTHVSSILRKLGVSSRSEAVALWLRSRGT
ncbi:MAG: LuxR C-terminal-related transcriptional regulator [Gordonia sp. (in: high G+C Gram-positive bacteria)]|uniref:LuxR C-terminal-related transcriptional regulator n=1 Tax=Gordonia sp. (in: high G+C Gram-positive bacteria) TaxID=84139 RepID=UPI0039E3CD77